MDDKETVHGWIFTGIAFSFLCIMMLWCGRSTFLELCTPAQHDSDDDDDDDVARLEFRSSHTLQVNRVSITTAIV